MASILEEREIALREAEHQVYLNQLIALHKVAIGGWLAYIAFDYLTTYVPGSVAFSWMVLLRVLSATLVGLGLFALTRFKLRRGLVRFLDLLLLIEPTIVITYFCWRDGLSSPFVAGHAFVITCRGGVIRDVWWRTLIHLSPPLIGVALCPFVAHGYPGAFREGASSIAEIVSFSHIGFIVVSSAVFATIGAHAAWKLGHGAYEGRSLGSYRLQNCIGVGAMGEVWSARDTNLKRDVALKMMKHDGASGSAQARARFDREIRALMAIDHPHAVRILDFGTSGDRINYFVMDLLSGADLAQLVKDGGPLVPSRALALLDQAARAVAHAHQLGIVHRDIKPSNLFISDSGDDIGHVRLLDFGIAKLDDETDESLTAKGAFVGTAHFAAPELAMGKEATVASDIYALGAVAYFALTGTTPFSGLTRAGILSALISGEVLDLQIKAPTLDGDTVALVKRAMHPRPEERFPSASAFAEAIRKVLWKLRAETSPERPALVLGTEVPPPPPSESGLSTVDGAPLALARAREVS